MKISRRIVQLKTIVSVCKKLTLGGAFQLLSRASEGLPNVVVKECEHGVFCGFENDHLFQSALRQGTNEPHFNEVVENLISKDSNVLDVGANIGTHSILLSKQASEGHVFSFEPQALVFSLLQNNLLLNNSKNVTAYRFAASDIDNKVLSMEPFSFSGEVINNGVLRLDNSGDVLGDLVLLKRLDSFDFPHIDFIKFDIQGSEVAALRGANKLISRDRPIMFVEVEEQHLKRFGANSKELIEKILSYDYVLYRIENEYPCDHLCIPSENVDFFENNVIGKFKFALHKIKGKKVELEFESENHQNYKSVNVVE